MSTNCNPPFVRGIGCCKCCPPPRCDSVKVTFNITKIICPSSSSSVAIITNCCNTPTPTILTMTFGSSSGAQPSLICLGGTICTLTYDPTANGGSGGWTGVSTSCTNNYNFLLICGSESNPTAWNISLTNIPNGGTCVGNNIPLTLNSCSPFNMTGSISGTFTCGSGSTGVPVTITE